MRTDDLISVMTAGLRPVDTAWLKWATALTALVALAIAVLLVLVTLGLRQDFANAWMTTPVITKLLFGSSLAAIALIVFERSLRPGLRPASYLWLILLPVGLVEGWAMMTLAQEPFDNWRAVAFGRNWRTCLIAVPLYAFAPLLLLLVLARRGAPIDLALTGVAAGIASAGLAIVGYGLHCSDDTVVFLAIWYPIAVGIVTALSAIAVSKGLRW